MTFRPDLKPNYKFQDAIKKQVRAEHKKTEQHNAFYKLVWRKKPHTCYECNQKVPVFNKYNIHHCVEKHLQDRYSTSLDVIENGVILCFICHSKVHTNSDFTPKVQVLTEILTKELEVYRLK